MFHRNLTLKAIDLQAFQVGGRIGDESRTGPGGSLL